MPWPDFPWQMAEAEQERNRPTTTHCIVRSDGESDALTGQSYSNYDMAYEQLERYYGDLCCSDDDRIDYVIVALNPSPAA